MDPINETHPFMVSLWVEGNDNPRSVFEKGHWVEWAHCTSRVKADEVALCLSIRNPSGVQAAEMLSDDKGVRFLGYRYLPETARELGKPRPL